jgi:methylmalonyl-CoA/ethylmalonyl-CoA epimerase
MPVKRINHIAIVVPNIEEALVFYKDVLGLTLTHTEHVAGQEVLVAFLPAGESEVELLEPVNETSGVARYLAKHGPGMHHISIEVDNLEATLARLKEHGVELINEEATIGSGGKKVAFVHPHSTYGVLIELYEATPEEPQRRAAILEALRTRAVVERQVVAAGVMAFLRALHTELTTTIRDGKPSGITLKAEGEMPVEDDQPG